MLLPPMVPALGATQPETSRSFVPGVELTRRMCAQVGRPCRPAVVRDYEERHNQQHVLKVNYSSACSLPPRLRQHGVWDGFYCHVRCVSSRQWHVCALCLGRTQLLQLPRLECHLHRLHARVCPCGQRVPALVGALHRKLHQAGDCAEWGAMAATWAGPESSLGLQTASTAAAGVPAKLELVHSPIRFPPCPAAPAPTACGARAPHKTALSASQRAHEGSILTPRNRAAHLAPTLPVRGAQARVANHAYRCVRVCLQYCNLAAVRRPC